MRSMRDYEYRIKRLEDLLHTEALNRQHWQDRCMELTDPIIRAKMLQPGPPIEIRGDVPLFAQLRMSHLEAQLSKVTAERDALQKLVNLKDSQRLKL